jgi:SAM-dependent methyltransferase
LRLSIDIETEVRRPEIVNLDLSVLAPADLVNLILQRSEVMYDIPRSGRIIRAWNAGDDGPINAVMAEKGTEIARRAAAVIHAEYQALRPVLDDIGPKAIADIGCGYGFFDLFAARDYSCDVVLIDLETNSRRHFGFQNEGAAYSSLAAARALLIANGVPTDGITTLNPESEDVLSAPPVDLAVSFLSCGFHYPVDLYHDFFQRVVRPGGHLILDLRAATADAQLALLSPMGTVTNLEAPDKAQRIWLKKSGLLAERSG